MSLFRYRFWQKRSNLIFRQWLYRSDANNAQFRRYVSNLPPIKRTHYEILGVDQTASDKDIKEAYFTLSKKYHPDTTSAMIFEADRFIEIKEAYDILRDAQKRRLYDEAQNVYRTQISEEEIDKSDIEAYEAWKIEQHRQGQPTHMSYEEHKIHKRFHSLAIMAVVMMIPLLILPFIFARSIWKKKREKRERIERRRKARQREMTVIETSNIT